MVRTVVCIVGSAVVGGFVGFGLDVMARQVFVTCVGRRNGAALAIYEDLLSKDRDYAVAEFSHRQRICYAPAWEELVYRVVPGFVWFYGSAIVWKMIAVVVWLLAVWFWAISHWWDTESSLRHGIHLRPHWRTSRVGRNLHRITMTYHAISYSAAFVLAGVLSINNPLHADPFVRAVVFLGTGWLAATSVHSLHNYLLLSPHHAGQIYRRWRRIPVTAKTPRHKQ